RTGVCTIPSSDTSVIGHLVKTFCTVGSSYHRAYRLTRSIVTMLTSHWLEGYFCIVCSNLQFVIGLITCWCSIVTVYSDPSHLPSVQDFLFTYYSYVVFDLTSHCTGTTADTRVHVYSHTPVVLAVFVPTPKRDL